MSRPVLLRGVDMAAVAVALVARLRGGGVAVAPSGPALLVEALHHMPPVTRADLYWAARLTLVDRMEDLAAFDTVFAAIFADAVLGLDPAGRRSAQLPPRAASHSSGRRSAPSGPAAAGELPWATPRPVPQENAADLRSVYPDVLPSRLTAQSDEPFDRLDPDDLRAIGSWLERTAVRWPRRTTGRREKNRHGTRIDLRATMRGATRTGGEMLAPLRSRPRRRPRRMVLICDVSRSMRPYSTIYLHLMRAVAQRRTRYRPEVFAFSTELTRLTAVLSHRSPELAIAHAESRVHDRYGGTHIARSLSRLLSDPVGNALRGAIVVIASDGWDSDPPEALSRAMARIHRRAWRVLWINPRAAEPGFRPATAAMSAALPYCDALLPAHNLTAIQTLLSTPPWQAKPGLIGG